MQEVKQMEPVRPEPASMKTFHEAMDKVNKTLGQPNPLIKAIEGIDRELTRTHTLIIAKIGAREYTSDEEKFLKTLREKFVELVDKLNP